MASIKQLDERKFKITVSNGYRPDGRKISKARTITVSDSVGKRGIRQYVSHAAEEMERTIKLNKLRPITLENMLVELRKRSNHGKSVQVARTWLQYRACWATLRYPLR